MAATNQVNFDEILDKCVDMSKVKLDALEAQIKTKISDIFKIEDFVNNELKFEKLMCPMKLHIHLTEFLNGPLVKQFICELWTILVAAEESAAAKANQTVESKDDEIRSKVIRTKNIEPTKNEILKKVFHRKIRKEAERYRSQSEKLDNKVSGRTKSLTSLSNFRSTQKPQRRTDIEKDANHHGKPVESASQIRSTNSQKSVTGIGTNAVQKQYLTSTTSSAQQLQLDKEPKQCISMVNGGKQALVPNKTFSSNLKPQGRINISKVKLDLFKPWISKKITDILEREDNAAIEFVFNKLKQDKMLCPQKFQIRIAGFLKGGKAQRFVCELWPLLLSAQQSESGIPAELMQQEKEENRRLENDIKHNGSTSLHYRSQSSQNKDGAGVVTCGLNGFANVCMYSPQQNAANSNSKDQHPSTQVRVFLLENCAEMNEFLQEWDEEPDKETITVSKKFIYPDEKHLEHEINATLLSPAGSSVRKSNFKRTHSAMVNESKKTKNDSSSKDESAKKKRTKAQTSLTKRSSGKDFSRKPKVKQTKQADRKESIDEKKTLELDLFGNVSSDEEEAGTNNLNIEKSTLELDLSISTDEEERSSGQPAARNSETVKENHIREKTTLELDLSISTDEEDV